jgi:hypothetical protein
LQHDLHSLIYLSSFALLAQLCPEIAQFTTTARDDFADLFDGLAGTILPAENAASHQVTVDTPDPVIITLRFHSVRHIFCEGNSNAQIR